MRDGRGRLARITLHATRRTFWCSAFELFGGGGTVGLRGYVPLGLEHAGVQVDPPVPSPRFRLKNLVPRSNGFGLLEALSLE